MGSRRLAWGLSKLGRYAARAVVPRLFRDPDPDPRRALIIAGTGRSGTTWLAEILASEVPSRLMFEPFNPEKVEEYRGFRYFQYRRPGEEDPPLLDYCGRLFRGEIRDRWIDREVACLRPRRRIVKTIRGLLLLGWIRTRFPDLPIVLIVRHPCAVVLSRLRSGWATDRDIRPLLSQPDLVEDHLGDRMEVIERARTDEAKHAVVWCVSYLVPLRQLEAGEVTAVFYERLYATPEVDVPRVFDAIGERHTERVYDAMRRPSRLAGDRSTLVAGKDPTSDWKQALSPKQIDSVLAVVEGFGLGHLYGDALMPRAGDPLGDSAARPG